MYARTREQEIAIEAESIRVQGILSQTPQRTWHKKRQSENDLNLRDKISRQKYADTSLQGYIDYLGTKEWNFFMTGTTPYTLTDKSARRLAERYYQKVQPYCDEMFFVTEKFELRDGMHLHALMKCENEGNFPMYVDMWQVATGNRWDGIDPVTKRVAWRGFGENEQGKEIKTARIQLERFQPRLGAEGYVAKYILKQHGDFDLLTPSALPKDEPVSHEKPQRVPRGWYIPEDEDE